MLERDKFDTSSMPKFHIREYIEIVNKLKKTGYTFKFIKDMSDDDSMCVYLRHDIDVHCVFAEGMAQEESKHGFFSTYYVLINSHYNIFYDENVRILKNILSLGHDIGLHYDIVYYPKNYFMAKERLDFEASILKRLLGVDIKTIVTHEPSRVTWDILKESIDYIHPHNPKYSSELLYVSDSRRMWRDSDLLWCFSDSPPKKLMLNTHPYSWLDGEIADNIEYLNKVIIPKGISQSVDYLNTWLRYGLEGKR